MHKQVGGVVSRAGYRTAALSFLALLAISALPARSGWLSIRQAQASPTTDFYSSFEPADPQPTWQNTLETDPHGQAKIVGITGSFAALGAGPPNGPVPDVGFTGLHAFQFGGSQTGAGPGYAYYKVFSVNVLVTDATQLSYDIFPEREPNELSDPSTYAALDLHFTDGTYLSALGAEDQSFIKVDPEAMGASDTLYPDQWNQIVSRIGAVAAGKTIDRILVEYDNPSGPRNHEAPAAYDDWLDDITITGNPAQTPADPVETTPADPTNYVVTTRGTEDSGDNGLLSRGASFPAVAVPNGFNFWTPQTDGGEPYAYASGNDAANLPEMTGFQANHEDSLYVNPGALFSFMPSPGPIASAVDSLPFSHASEIAQPQYYSVTFENGMRTEITPTNHAAVFRFTFTTDTSTLSFSAGNLSVDQAAGVVTGSGGGTYFYAYFDAPITATSSGFVQFDTSVQKVVTMKIATSYISLSQAKHNLALEISPSDTFGAVEARARALWDKRLDGITVEGATNDELTTLYSDLYRVNLYPNTMAENTGTNTQPDWVHYSPYTQTVVNGPLDVGGGFWDEHQTEWPLYALLEPTVAGELINGEVEQYKESGWINQWSTSTGSYTGVTGTDSDVAFADAYINGVTNFDVDAAYDAALKDATVPGARDQLNTSIFLGYTPPDYGSVDWSQENDVNDFGIANMAKALYERSSPSDPRREEYLEEYEYFLSSSLEYADEYDPALGFFQDRLSSGQWALTPEEFDPRVWGGPYTESDAWNYSFPAVFDGQGLANLYGGKAELAAKLDGLFDTPETAEYPGAYGATIPQMTQAEDARFGQWGIPDQPSFHIAYMYDYAGEPYKTQSVIRAAENRLFGGSDIGQGYFGDDDSGSMSSWQVFSALGFYPLQGGTPYYVIGSPLYKEVTLRLENGKQIVINAPNNSPTNVYIQRMTLDGKPYEKTYLSQSQLAQGAVLDFVMGPKPSGWGTATGDAPLSVTVGNGLPVPIHDVGVGDPARVSASGGTDVQGLFDDDSNTQVTFSSPTPWVQERLTAGPRKVTFYTLTSGASPGGDPTSWMLEGSNDGAHWATLDVREGEAFAWRLQTRPFKVANAGLYAYYRLVVTKTAGDVASTLAEVQFLAGGITSFDGEGVASIEGPGGSAASAITAGAEGETGSGGALGASITLQDEQRLAGSDAAAAPAPASRGGRQGPARRSLVVKVAAAPVWTTASGMVAVRVRCLALSGTRCAGSLRIGSRRNVLGSRNVAIDAGGWATVRLRLTAGGYRELVDRRDMMVTLRLALMGPAGGVRQASSRVVLWARASGRR